jgi:hypothetical protein
MDLVGQDAEPFSDSASFDRQIVGAGLSVFICVHRWFSHCMSPVSVGVGRDAALEGKGLR